jgi:hypothetical protein
MMKNEVEVGFLIFTAGGNAIKLFSVIEAPPK